MNFRKMYRLLSIPLILTNLFSYLSVINAIDEQTECTICLEDFNGQDTTTLLCGHKFCKECIDKWEKDSFHYTCPICRGPIVRNNNANQNNNRVDNFIDNDDDRWREFNELHNQVERDLATQIRLTNELDRQLRKMYRARKMREEEEKERSRKYNAPTDKDGLTKYEREYYEKNYKKILDEGLEKISRADNRKTLNDAYCATRDKIRDLIYKVRTYELGLHYEHMIDYTRNVLSKAKDDRWEEIKPPIEPKVAVPAIGLGALGSARVYHILKQKNYENILYKDIDIDTNSDSDTEADTNDATNDVDKNNITEINNIFDLINSD